MVARKFFVAFSVFAVFILPSIASARGIGENDDPAALFADLVLERNLFVLDESAEKKVRLKLAWKPWADASWIPRKGMIAARYQNSSYVERSIEENYRRTMAKSLKEIAQEGKKESIATLSPAEKYDLLTGDLNGTFTEGVWKESKRVMDTNGYALWLGLCDGSAGAAVALPEPLHKITVKSQYRDLPIEFSPLDIKALAAHLWSVYGISMPVVGSRCNDESFLVFGPGEKSLECQDNNPASWHLAAVNLLGMQKGNLVVDRDPSRPVWNVPVLGYEIQYRNPKSGRRAKVLKDAVVALSVLQSKDEYQERRDSRAKFLVNVEMKVLHGRTLQKVKPEGVNPLTPDEREYSYDLELDDSFTIIGGEWHDTNRPDFMWAIGPNTQPKSSADITLAGQAWDGTKVPAEWNSAVHISSARLQLMAAIVQKLVELSAAPVSEE
jgi:hypothetical protein